MYPLYKCQIARMFFLPYLEVVLDDIVQYIFIHIYILITVLDDRDERAVEQRVRVHNDVNNLFDVNNFFFLQLNLFDADMLFITVAILC